MVPNSETDCTNSTSTSWYQTDFSYWEADKSSAALAFCIIVSGKERISDVTKQTASRVLKSYGTAITVRQYREILQITAGQNKPLPKAKEAPLFLAHHLLMPLCMYMPFPSPSFHLCKLFQTFLLLTWIWRIRDCIFQGILVLSFEIHPYKKEICVLF